MPLSQLSTAGERSPEIQKLSVTIYRLLALGAPVSIEDLAADTAQEIARIAECLKEFSPSAIIFDDAGAIIGFGGLSIEKADHQFLIENVRLYTWCVLDALFVPEIIGQQAHVITKCPATKTTIELDVAPTQLLSCQPSSAVMSIVEVNADACKDNLRQAFCNHVNFFKSAENFLHWAKQKPAMSCIDLPEAFVVGQKRNRSKYPDLSL